MAPWIRMAAQALISGGQIAGRAFMQAYQQAVVSMFYFGIFQF